MSRQSEGPAHPGAFIRERVIPSGMSVTEAAKKLDVGRPALSNLLNGNSSLSAGMAARLETAFGANRRELLDRQAAFDRDDPRAEEQAVATVGACVPDFLMIEGRRIAAWADGNLEARQLLPVLLRKLIHSTGRDLRRVDFPGYDNAERKGWDGTVEADAATPWISEGKSGWEFGANEDPRRKAEDDYAARLASVPAAERAERSFVFVTPRNWPGKAEWVEGKRAAGDWKAVRAFDASDLEQWLEQSISARMWFAEKLDMPTAGFETLDACWQRWAAASDPRMTPAIFEPSLSAYRDVFKEWLEKPSDRPFTVAADSREEALAFLSCMFEEDGIDTHWRDLAAVFESARTLRKLGRVDELLESDPCGHDMNKRQERPPELFIAGGNAAELLELVEEPFDLLPRPVLPRIVRDRLGPVRFRRDDGFNLPHGQEPTNGVAVIRLVHHDGHRGGQHWHPLPHRFERHRVIALSASQHERHPGALVNAGRVHLGGEPTPRAPQSLGLLSAVFLTLRPRADAPVQWSNR